MALAIPYFFGDSIPLIDRELRTLTLVGERDSERVCEANYRA